MIHKRGSAPTLEEVLDEGDEERDLECWKNIVSRRVWIMGFEKVMRPVCGELEFDGFLDSRMLVLL